MPVYFCYVEELLLWRQRSQIDKSILIKIHLFLEREICIYQLIGWAVPTSVLFIYYYYDILTTGLQV